MTSQNNSGDASTPNTREGWREECTNYLHQRVKAGSSTPAEAGLPIGRANVVAWVAITDSPSQREQSRGMLVSVRRLLWPALQPSFCQSIRGRAFPNTRSTGSTPIASAE